MGQRETIPVTFGQKLRAELKDRGWGIRTLAREMAVQGNTPDRIESLRRQLKRYLTATDPVQPTVSTRRLIEDALGLERDALAPSEDDEEAAQAMPRDLLEGVRALKRLLELVDA